MPPLRGCFAASPTILPAANPEFTTGFSGTYTVDSAIALFKRGFVGSYHKLSKDRLDSYLGEFSWRFNRRHLQPDMFDLALRNVSERKPLTFKKLTREVF